MKDSFYNHKNVQIAVRRKPSSVDLILKSDSKRRVVSMDWATFDQLRDILNGDTDMSDEVYGEVVG